MENGYYLYFTNRYTLLKAVIMSSSCLIKIDEKGTLKATEHDKYEDIAGSV
jgi:hypothetical protein